MTRSEWIAERYRIPGVGASDAANLIGIGFQSARDVFNDKLNPPTGDDVPTTGWRARGLALEATAAAMYELKMQTPLDLPPNAIVRHRDREWQFCSPDRVRADGRMVEIKSAVGVGDEWGAEGTDQIPDSYMTQVQHSLGVLAASGGAVADWCDVACLDIVQWQLRVFRVRFNPAFFEWLTEIEARFVADHLLPKVPPGPEWGDRFAAPALAMIRPGTAVDLGPAGEVLAERRRRVGEVRKQCEAEYDRLTAELRALMGTAERATAGAFTLKQSVVKGGPVTYTREDYMRLDVRAKK